MSQFELFKERQKRERVKRDDALDRLEVTRAYVLNLARDIARKLEQEKGSVSSSEVLFILRAEIPEMLEGIDPRFMGAVFRNGWTRAGYELTGSHCRPVSIWKRKAAA